MNTKFTIIRDVTKKECSWLENDILKGEIIYEFLGHTYNCIGDGVACTHDPEGDNPFFEIPIDAIEKIN